MHIPGMGKGRVRDPYGQGTLGFRHCPGLLLVSTYIVPWFAAGSYCCSLAGSQSSGIRG